MGTTSLNGKPKNILFLCTGNSARSILSEALASDPTVGCGRLVGYSAGSQPTGRVHPIALETLDRHGIAISDPRSKNWSEFTTREAPVMDYMITVCGNAAAESCPVWPGRPATAHWGVPDPAAVTDNESATRAAFESAFQTLRRRIHAFASLDLHALTADEAKSEARRIASL